MSTAQPPFQPPPQQQPQPTLPSPFPPIRKRPWFKRWWAIVLFVIVGLGILGALLNPDGGTPTTTAVPGPTVTVTKTVEAAPDGREPTEAPEPEPTKAPAAFNPKPRDFTVGIKVLRKECFGSAGCNLSYRIVPDYKGSVPIPADAALDVTYQVSGAEDPIIGTFTVVDGKANFNEEESASTTSSGKKLTAKVTEVTVQ